jgi:uncharacterized protein
MQLHALLLLALAQVPVPAPRGFVNDFAGVLDSATAARMEQVLADVRAKTRGEIAVVTLPDLNGRSAGDVAVQIGRQWGVGAKGNAGDPAKNLGVVVLLVPRKNHRPGSGDVFIATGRGAEGFLTDARVGRIQDAILPYLAQENYGAALTVAVDSLAQAFAQEFGVAIGPALPVPLPGPAPWPHIPPGMLVVLIALFVVLVIVTRGRILLLPFRLGFRFRGGGGGGRFGGFGGGGGFSGGGAGRKF